MEKVKLLENIYDRADLKFDCDRSHAPGTVAYKVREGCDGGAHLTNDPSGNTPEDTCGDETWHLFYLAHEYEEMS